MCLARCLCVNLYVWKQRLPYWFCVCVLHTFCLKAGWGSTSTKCLHFTLACASRFSRDLINQEIGFKQLSASGFKLIAAANPNQFLDDGPTSKLIWQVLGAIAEFEKSNIVAKLKGARHRAAERKGLKTLKGTFQAAGFRSKLHGAEGQTIMEVLGPFARKAKLKRGEWKEAASACSNAGIKNAKGNELKHGTLKRCIQSFQKGCVQTLANGPTSQEVGPNPQGLGFGVWGL